MVFSNDVVKFVVDRDLIDDPGTRMNYNSGCSHILTAILQKATGMKASVFAEKYLFGPLGIQYVWVEDNKGVNRGADGLRLTSCDMSKFGQLYLRNGVWNSEQIISAEWVRRSTEPYYMTYNDIGQYAYHWWVRKLNSDLDDGSTNRIIFTMGYGGQFICLIPRWKMVIVFISELYTTTFKPMERFCIIKKELIYLNKYETRAGAERSIFEYIMLSLE